MNIPQSPEARLVQVSLLPVWVETQLRPPRLPVPSHPVLGFQNLTGNPERQHYDVKRVSFYWHIWEREGCPSCLPETLKSISDAFVERKKIQVSTPLKCCQWIVGGLVFDEPTYKLCDCDLSAVLYFSQTKKPHFFLLFSTWVYRLCHNWKYTFLPLLLTKVDESVSVTQCCSLIFTVSSHAGELQKWRI